MKTNKMTRKAQIQKLLDGTAKRYAGVTMFMIAGVAIPLADLVKLFESDLAAMEAAEAAKAAKIAAVAKEAAVHAQVDPFLRLFKQVVVGQFGDTAAASEALADFGLAPRKKPVLSVEAKQLAADKRLATRAARHTMGPKQKSRIKGELPVDPTKGPPHA